MLEIPDFYPCRVSVKLPCFPKEAIKTADKAIDVLLAGLGADDLNRVYQLQLLSLSHAICTKKTRLKKHFAGAKVRWATRECELLRMEHDIACELHARLEKVYQHLGVPTERQSMLASAVVLVGCGELAATGRFPLSATGGEHQLQ